MFEGTCLQMGVDPLNLDARRLLNLRYSMMFTPFTDAEQAEAIRWAFDWPPTREEWGSTPEALAAQDAMVSGLGSGFEDI